LYEKNMGHVLKLYSLFVQQPSISGKYANFFEELQARMAFHAMMGHGTDAEPDDDYSDMPPLETPEPGEESIEEDEDEDEEEEEQKEESDGENGGAEEEGTVSETECGKV
jgi:cobalamin biosynthesis protein CobT